MKILILPGDGIGPEIMPATLHVLDRANQMFKLDVQWQREEIGLRALRESGSTLPPHVMELAASAPGVILGPMSRADYPERARGGINISAEFRVKLDLYANIRPARSRPGLSHGGKPMDLVIYRECTEGFYADRNMHMGLGEFMPTDDTALAIRRVTAKCSNRIARRAFEGAMARRKKVAAVHKVGVLPMTDGLFLREVDKVAADFPEVQLEKVNADAMAALLVREPARFDVIVTGNMFGDILSDEASELSGSLGLAGSVMAGDQQCIAQAQHGSAPDIAGQDRANPTSLIVSAAMLYEWLAPIHGARYAQAAKAISAAVDAVLADAATRTRDLGGTLGTQAFAQAVASRLA